MGDDRLGARRRRRHQQNQGHGSARAVRWHLSAHRAEKLRKRVRDYLLHDHRGGSGGRDRPGHVRSGLAGGRVGRLIWGDPDRSVGRPWDGRNPKPCVLLRRVSRDPHGVAGSIFASCRSRRGGSVNATLPRLSPEWRKSLSRRRASRWRGVRTICALSSEWNGQEPNWRVG